MIYFQVTVLLVDINDHSPVIQQTSPVSVTVLEHSAVGTLITVISAVDVMDFGINTRIVYEIISGNEDCKFDLFVDCERLFLYLECMVRPFINSLSGENFGVMFLRFSR